MAQIGDLGAETVIESGPGDVLSRMAKRDLKGVTIASARTPEEAAEAARAAQA
jgi:malonyl CoA-acyl carrier protein transacylase